MKKLLATLVMGAVSVTSVIGFTACGDNNNGVPKGKKVNEEEWKTAITATLDATNFTMQIKTSYSATERYKDEDGADVNATESSNGTYEIYVNDTKAYNTETLKSKSTGEENVEVEFSSEFYMEIEGTDLWLVSLESEKYLQGAPEGYEEKTPEWEAYKREHTNADAAKEGFKECIGMEPLESSYSTSKDGESKKLVDLYSVFTYSDGKYTATLYVEHEIEMQVEISINDGHLVGYGYTYSDESEEDGFYGKSEVTYSYVFKDYGSTAVTAPEGATAAIAKVKNGENK